MGVALQVWLQLARPQYREKCRVCLRSTGTKIIPTLQERLEGNLLLVVGEERVGDPSSKNSPELIQERSMLLPHNVSTLESLTFMNVSISLHGP
jgi:hypothetical protein